MRRLTRRSILKGGAFATAAMAIGGSAPATAETANRLDIWAANPDGLTVPTDRWTLVPWPKTLINDTDVRLDSDGASWLFPPGPEGIFAILANLAWDNAISPSGQAIRPPTHRKLARIMQQGVGVPQLDQIAYSGGASEVVYVADLALRGSQRLLSDGSRGYQQQQVSVQAGMPARGGVSRVWVEVYQDSGMSIACRWDGTNAPRSATRPPVVGLLAPSLMIGKLAPF